MTRLEVPGYVRESHGAHGGTVLLDARSGHCFAMNPVARALWQEWRRSRDFEAGVRMMARLYPEPCHERIEQDARELAGALVRRGLLAVAPAGGTPTAVPGDAAPPGDPHDASGTRNPAGAARAPVGAEVAMAADPPARPPRASGLPARRTPVPGLLGLLIALLLIRLPFRVLVRVVEWTGHRWCRQEATAEQGAASLAAVRQAAARYPGRAACLETSLAALMTLALRRRRVVWCIGTAVDPYRFHAWIEARGVPIKTADEHGVENFQRILSV
ncbi:lasso peptide biosynthesis B2 protein [Streptomyces sp. NPDC006193]|uniref:lasso peptide biosynthesis B2 protein n=1 Tax=Streptomyces sp. NPDC006193 TaxID=3155717 RepID=UPI0033BA0A6C